MVLVSQENCQLVSDLNHFFQNFRVRIDASGVEGSHQAKSGLGQATLCDDRSVVVVLKEKTLNKTF